MEMEKKEELVIGFIKREKDQFEKKNPGREYQGAEYSQIKNWVIINGCEKFGPATLTSMVKRGILTKDSYYNLPKEREISSEERVYNEYSYKLRDLDGLLKHMNNSSCSWRKQLEAQGIDFPEEEWRNWSNEVIDRVEREIEKVKSEYKEETGLDYNQFNGAF